MNDFQNLTENNENPLTLGRGWIVQNSLLLSYLF